MVALFEVVWEIAGAGDEPHRRNVGGFRSRQHRGFRVEEWLPQIGDAAKYGAAGSIAGLLLLLGMQLGLPLTCWAAEDAALRPTSPDTSALT